MPDFKSDEIYKLEIYNRHAAPGEAYCDFIVTDENNTIYAASLIGQDTKVKMAAWLMQEGRVGQLYRAEGNRYGLGHIRHNVHAIATRKKAYDEEYLRLDEMTQLFIVAKNAKPDLKARSAWMQEEQRRLDDGATPRSLPDHLSELILSWDGDYRKQIYNVLNDRYNTPMLEEWADFIIEALIDRKYYQPLLVKVFGSDYDLEAGLLAVTEEQLEEIIQEGIQGYELDFAIEEDGRSEDEAVLTQCHSIDDYLTHFAGELGSRIQENIQLRFDPETEKHHASLNDVNLQANKNGLTGLYPPQANTVMGVSRTLKEDNYCFVIGEMG